MNEKLCLARIATEPLDFHLHYEFFFRVQLYIHSLIGDFGGARVLNFNEVQFLSVFMFVTYCVLFKILLHITTF